MKFAIVIITLLIIAGTAVTFVARGDRNQLRQEREAIDIQWSQVDVALQRRADLVPGLVDILKSYAKQEDERTAIKQATEARGALAAARDPQAKIQANVQLDTPLSRLLVMAEKYPQLRSNETFQHWHESWEAAENRIAQERRKYNEAIQRYNTDIELFPKNIAAAIFGFERNDAYFKTEPNRVAF